MSKVTGNINGSDVAVQMGDITQSQVDAIMVPQFTSCSSYGGVGGAVARSGAEAGMQAYDDYVSEAGEQKFGAVLLTPSGGGKSSQLLHVVTVGSGAEHEFNTVKTAFYNALKVAGDNGVKSIAAPALGTGIIGSLAGKQSAEAMMSAIKEYREEGGTNISVNFVIYGDREAYAAFTETLKSGQFASANDMQEGRRQFDAARWVTGMARDARANENHFGAAAAASAPKSASSAKANDGYDIVEMDEFPSGSVRYIPVHPDDVEITSKALIDHIGGFYKRIPVHHKTIQLGDEQVALLWSGDPNFYFGIGEGRQVPKYTPRLLDIDMKALQDNLPIDGDYGAVSVVSGQGLITMPIGKLQEVLPEMYARREQIKASGEALLWSGYDKPSGDGPKGGTEPA